MDSQNEKQQYIVSQFQGDDTVVSIAPCGKGLIQDTFVVTGDTHRYILQRINTDVFRHPVELMQNIRRVTDFLRAEVEKKGGNSEREAMRLIPSASGECYYIDKDGGYWRMYLFVENSYCPDMPSVKEFYESAVSFGRFQYMLRDFDAGQLHETLPHFHDTPKRLEALKKAMHADVKGRLAGVKDLCEFALLREEDTHALEKANLPLRVTHNDTKINNILFDRDTGRGLCVIDLDTVMPGLAVNDFGDSIRFGASTAEEDETNLDKVSMDLHMFDAYTRGFLEGCHGSLRPEELDMLPMGAKMMTLECGIRFLTDYLQGDTYFRIQRPEHNLDRCRTQFKLVADMERKWKDMQRVVEQYR